jgi:hypothetical protein
MAAVAADMRRVSSGWTLADRLMLCHQVSVAFRGYIRRIDVRADSIVRFLRWVRGVFFAHTSTSSRRIYAAVSFALAVESSKIGKVVGDLLHYRYICR